MICSSLRLLVVRPGQSGNWKVVMASGHMFQLARARTEILLVHLIEVKECCSFTDVFGCEMMSPEPVGMPDYWLPTA